MSKKLKFDEINEIDTITEYFAPMQISDDDKARRRELTEYLIDAFLFFFATYDVHRQFNELLEKQLYTQLLADRIADAVTKVTGIDSYMSDHIKEISKSVVDTTFKNAPKTEKQNIKSAAQAGPGVENSFVNKEQPTDIKSRHTHFTPLKPAPLEYISDGPLETPLSGGPSPQKADANELKDSVYWLSYRRAEDIAKSEANSFLNYTDYLDAVATGAKYKTWHTMLDDKVRETHFEVEGQTIGVDELFTVGDSLMRFPHDMESAPDPQEVIGCRCSVEYSK